MSGHEPEPSGDMLQCKIICRKGLFHIHNSVFPVLHTTNWLVYTLYTLNMYFEFFSLAEIQVFSQKSQYGAFYHNLGE